jgi:hypothetical protein
MPVRLAPKPGFNWSLVAWGKPDSPRSAVCSYCFAAIGDGDVPLILWKDDGHAAQFCAGCQRTWWGMTSYHDEGDAR